jgi:energy-converting hydrogenase A subunit M
MDSSNEVTMLNDVRARAMMAAMGTITKKRKMDFMLAILTDIVIVIFGTVAMQIKRWIS